MSLTAAARPDVSSMAMVAVYPSAEEAAAIALDGGNPAETLHVTLVFLGDVASLDLDAVRRVLASVASETEALSGSVTGVGLFQAGEDGYPQIAIPSAKGLSSLRAEVVEELAEAGIESPSEFDWVPHMTLLYTDEPSLASMELSGLPLTFSSLTLTIADVREDFAFGGEEEDEEREEEAVSYSRWHMRRKEMLLQQARSLCGASHDDS